MKGDYLGEFEHIVLLGILHLEEDAYGVSLKKLIENRTGRRTGLGPVYSALRRLESKGLIAASHTQPTPTRGGRSKKVFGLTRLGREKLAETQAIITRMSDGVEVSSKNA